jgi:hypothetical protein
MNLISYCLYFLSQVRIVEENHLSIAGADLGFFVPQSKFFGGRGVVGAGRDLDWA